MVPIFFDQTRENLASINDKTSYHITAALCADAVRKKTVDEAECP